MPQIVYASTESTTVQQLEQASKNCLNMLREAAAKRSTQQYSNLLSSAHQKLSDLKTLLDSTGGSLKNTSQYRSALALCSLGFSWIENEAKASPSKIPGLAAPPIQSIDASSVEYKKTQNLLNATIAGGAIGLSERRIAYLADELNKSIDGNPGLLTFGFKTKNDANSFMAALDWLNVTGVKMILDLNPKNPTVGIPKDEYGVLFGVQTNYVPKEMSLPQSGNYKKITGSPQGTELVQSFYTSTSTESQGSATIEMPTNNSNRLESSHRGNTELSFTYERAYDKPFKPNTQSIQSDIKLAQDPLKHLADYFQMNMNDSRFKPIIQQESVSIRVIDVTTQEAMLTGRETVSINGVPINTIDYWKSQLNDNYSLGKENGDIVAAELYRWGGIRCEVESRVAIYQSLTGDFKSYAQQNGGGYTQDEAQANRNKLISLLEGYLKSTDPDMQTSAEYYLKEFCGEKGAFKKEGENYVVADAHKLWVLMAQRKESGIKANALAHTLNDMRTNTLLISGKETLSIGIDNITKNTAILTAKRTFGDMNLDVLKSNLHVFIEKADGTKYEIPQDEIIELGNGRFKITNNNLLADGKLTAYAETPGGKVNSGWVWQAIVAPKPVPEPKEKRLVPASPQATKNKKITYSPFIEITDTGRHLPAGTGTVTITGSWKGENVPKEENDTITGEIICPIYLRKNENDKTVKLDPLADLQLQSLVPYYFAFPSEKQKGSLLKKGTTIVEFEGHPAPLDRTLKVSENKEYTIGQLQTAADSNAVGYYDSQANSFHALDGWRIYGLAYKDGGAFASADGSIAQDAKPKYKVEDSFDYLLSGSVKRPGDAISYLPSDVPNVLSTDNRFAQPSLALPVEEKSGPNRDKVKFGSVYLPISYVQELGKENIFAVVQKEMVGTEGNYKYAIYSLNGESLGTWNSDTLEESFRPLVNAKGLSLRFDLEPDIPLEQKIYSPNTEKGSISGIRNVTAPGLNTIKPRAFVVGEYYEIEEVVPPKPASTQEPKPFEPPNIAPRIKFEWQPAEPKEEKKPVPVIYYQKYADETLKEPVLTAGYSGRQLTETEKAYWGDGYPLAIETQNNFTKISCDFMNRGGFADEAQSKIFVEKQLILNEQTNYFEVLRGVEGGYSDEQILIWMQHNSTSTIRAAKGTVRSDGTGTKVWLADAQFSKLKLTGQTQEARIQEAVAYITSDKGVSEMVEAQNLWVQTPKRGRVKMTSSKYLFSSNATEADLKKQLTNNSLPMPADEVKAKILGLENGMGINLGLGGHNYYFEMKDGKLNVYTASNKSWTKERIENYNQAYLAWKKAPVEEKPLSSGQQTSTTGQIAGSEELAGGILTTSFERENGKTMEERLRRRLFEEDK